MTNNPTIDGVSRELRALLERVVGKPTGKLNWDALDENRIAAAEELRALLDAPSCQTCSDSGAVGNILDVQPCPDCAALAPAVERQEPDYYEKIGNIIDDLLAGRTLTAMSALRTMQAWESAQKPLMVTFVDHKKGLDAYLEQITALQSTIAQLQERIAELESGRGEPVEALLLNDCVEMANREYGGGYFGTDVVQLYTAPPAPVAVVLPERDLLRDKIAEAIGGDTYDCTRVWSAWGVGTMDQYDFVSLVEQEDRLYEIVDACLDATAALNGVKS